MERFIKAYPGVVISLGGLTVILMGFLLTYPLYSINDSIEQIRMDMQNVVKEIKEDRREDRKELATVKWTLTDRISKLETRCEPLFK